MAFPFARCVTAFAVALSATIAFAADTGGNAADALAPARAHIASKQWPAAIGALREVGDTGNPDWHNLMGYSLRRSAKPDLVAAQHHYDEALRIDPSHRGALVYSGELALMKNDLPSAQQKLARLLKTCGGKCTDYRDLDDAINRYKANGNKYVGW